MAIAQGHGRTVSYSALCKIRERLEIIRDWTGLPPLIKLTSARAQTQIFQAEFEKLLENLVPNRRGGGHVLDFEHPETEACDTPADCAARGGLQHLFDQVVARWL